uniref:Ribosomal protein L32 n=1 Tax=Romanomermis culicivorax TaxID=13658 RepID=A0A915HFH2_ROMCU
MIVKLIRPIEIRKFLDFVIDERQKYFSTSLKPKVFSAPHVEQMTSKWFLLRTRQNF